MTKPYTPDDVTARTHNQPRVHSPEYRFDSDAYNLRSLLDEYLACHDALDDVQRTRRDDAVAGCIDFLTNGEIAAAAAWMAVRGAGLARAA